MRRTHFLAIPLFFLAVLAIPFLSSFLGEEGGVVSQDRPLTSGLLETFHQPYILLFFGYVGCADVCTPRLGEIRDIYNTLPESKQREVAVLFINIKKFPDKTLADLFAKSFHPDFYGVTPQKKERAHLIKEFNVYYSQSLFEPGEMDHTAFLFLLKKGEQGYRLQEIFTHTPWKKELIAKYLE